MTIDGQSSYVVGLNQVGLRRAGFEQETLVQLKEAYRLIYRSGLMWQDILRRLQEEFVAGLAAEFYPFLAATTRGILPERRMPPGATIKLRHGRGAGVAAAIAGGMRRKEEGGRMKAEKQPTFILHPSTFILSLDRPSAAV